MRSPNASYLPAVDQLRAIAAMLVLFQHCVSRIGGRLAFGHGGELVTAPAASPLDALLIEGHTGVALFMVLSGFIFTRTAYGERIRYSAFILNRVLRIYPLMIAIFCAGALVVGLAEPIAGVAAVLLIPFQIPGPFDLWFVPQLYPFTTLYWTIAPEFQFYLAFPVLLWLLNQMGARAIVLLLIGMAALRFGFSSHEGAHSLSYWTIVGRIDQFLIGMLLAAHFVNAREAPSVLLFPAASLGVFLLLFAYNRAGGLPVDGTWKLFWPTVEGLAWAAFILGYLHFAPRLGPRVSGALTSIGEVSFSMYLLHVTVISAVIQIGPLTFGLDPIGAALVNAILLVLPLTVGVSWVSYRLIERPFLRRRVRYIAEGSPQPSHPMATRAHGAHR